MTTMMTPTVTYMKQGDTAPALAAQLIDQYGVVPNLSGATVYFKATNSFYGNIINSTATITNAALGEVSYSWGTDDTQNPGTYSTQWYVVFSSGAQESYPQGFYDTLQIDPNLSSGFTQLQPTAPLFNTIWNSTSAPTAVQGNNGDFWLDTTTNYFYGPKANGAWPAGYLVNPAGAPLNSFGNPTGNVNMNQFSFNNLAYIDAAPTSTSQVAITANAPSGSTVDVLDIELNSVKYWSVNDSGNFNGIGQMNIAPTSTTLIPLVVNSPSGTSVDVADFQVNGTTQWKINDIGTLSGIAQLAIAPTSTSTTPLLVNAPSGTTVDLVDFQVNGTTAWGISDAGVLYGNNPLVVAPTSTAVVPATFNLPSGSSNHVANFQSSGTTVASVYGNGQVNGVALSATGVTGATSPSRYVGATSGGAPTSGTFASGDYIVDIVNGAMYVCTASGTPGTWNSVASGSLLVGPGQTTDITSSGGSSRTTQTPFVYSTSAVVTTTTGSGWSTTSSGTTFHGIGAFSVTMGAQSNDPFIIACNQPTISGGNLTLSGLIFTNNSSTGSAFELVGIASSLNVRLNIIATAW